MPVCAFRTYVPYAICASLCALSSSVASNDVCWWLGDAVCVRFGIQHDAISSCMLTGSDRLLWARKETMCVELVNRRISKLRTANLIIMKAVKKERYHVLNLTDGRDGKALAGKESTHEH